MPPGMSACGLLVGRVPSAQCERVTRSESAWLVGRAPLAFDQRPRRPGFCDSLRL